MDLTDSNDVVHKWYVSAPIDLPCKLLTFWIFISLKLKTYILHSSGTLPDFKRTSLTPWMEIRNTGVSNVMSVTIIVIWKRIMVDSFIQCDSVKVNNSASHKSALHKYVVSQIRTYRADPLGQLKSQTTILDYRIEHAFATLTHFTTCITLEQ